MKPWETLLFKEGGGGRVARGKKVTQKEKEEFQRESTKAYRCRKCCNKNTNKYMLDLGAQRPLMMTFNENDSHRVVREEARGQWAEEVEWLCRPASEAGQRSKVKKGTLSTQGRAVSTDRD